jgi:hypothetical protein
MENMGIGLYTARRLVSMMNAVEAPIATSKPSPPRARVKEAAGLAYEPPVETPAERASWAPTNKMENEEMGFFRSRRKAEAAPPQVDRSKAVTVKYYPNTDRYNRRNCIFHGEPAVTVCPNCGTLFCMECTKVIECPRCHTPLSFVDGSKEAIDDSDVIETEEQRLAIQKRWAQKRLADAEKTDSRAKVRSRPTNRDAMSERAIRIAEQVMKPDRPAEPTIQTFQSAPAAEPAPVQPTSEPVPKRRVAEPAAAPRRKGASSLVAAAMAYEAPPAEGPKDEPAPEEIIPQEREVSDKENGEKDKMERLRALLDQPEEDEEGGAARDLSRL